jgi:hypothetical protein
MRMFPSGKDATRRGPNRGRPDAPRRRSDILAGILYLICAIGLAGYFEFWIGRLFPIWTDDFYVAALLLGAVLLAVASFRAFSARKFGDLIAFAGAVLAWRFFVLVEFSQYRYPVFFNAWTLFNGTEAHIIAYAGLRIFAIVALLTATIHSLLRMTPAGWRFRDRIWPAFAVSFVGVAIWYLAAVTPYRIPVSDLHQDSPAMMLLQVEKDGIRFHETRLDIDRHGHFYLADDDRRLFAYGFTRNVSRGYLADDGMKILKEIKDSQDHLQGSHFSFYRSPRNWTADRWYVLFDPWGRGANNIALSVIPGEFPALLQAARTVTKEENWSDTRRDVCLGFCYDPTF